MVVYDWEGNFKKGTFKLNSTWVPKKKKMSFGKALLAGFATVATGGVGALLFVDLDNTIYKRSVTFDGQNDNWGKMTYMKNSDLSQFNNHR